MRLLLTLFLLLPLTVGATTYTEFYVQTTGSNLNSGHTTDDAATYSATGGNWTNNTSATTGTWFKSGESLAAVTNGAWAALYTDGTTTNAQYVGMVTAVSDANDTITISLQNYAGANPSTVVAGMSIKVGGAWKGFTTNTMANGGGFPFNFLSATATNAQNVFPRCNIKSGTTYIISAAITHANAGPCTFQGYTTAVGDGGKATIDGGSTGTSYVLLTVSGVNNIFADLIFANNGNSGSASGVSVTGTEDIFYRCVAHDMYRSGFVTTVGTTFIECEAYSNDKSNTSGHAGFNLGGNVYCIRCISHDNATANASGFALSAANSLINCIADSNGKDGITSTSTTGGQIDGCDFYNNTACGVDMTATSTAGYLIENCNFFKNGTYGIASSGAALRNGLLLNCAFGSGTQTNASGNIASNLGGIDEVGSITYTGDSTPWTDPANGDFRISATATPIKAKGRGAFTQTAASYTGTVAYPDVGAAQSASTNTTASAAGGSYTWSQ